MALALAFGGGLLHPATAAALLGLAPGLPFGAVGAVAEALVQRDLDFRRISASEVLRALIDGAVAVTLAWMGFGAAALAVGVLASRAVPAVVVAGFGGHARALVPRFGGFGLRHVATDLLPSAGGLALNAVLTGFLGAATHDLYSRAEAIRAMLDRWCSMGSSSSSCPSSLRRSGRAGPRPTSMRARSTIWRRSAGPPSR